MSRAPLPTRAPRRRVATPRLRGGVRGLVRGAHGGGRRRTTTPERGTVTVELALGLPAVVGVLVMVLVLSAAAGTQLRCADGARAGARAAAIGEDAAVVRATAARVAGRGATVGVERDGGWVTVTVTRRVVASPLGAGDWTARGQASARVEP